MVNFSNIRTAVIGAGSMGKHHARVYSEISDLAFIVEPNEKLGKEVATKYGAKWLSNYEDLYDKVDAVSIVVPTTLHREIFEDLCLANINIIVEKPLALSIEECQSMIEKSKNSNLSLGVGHIERHNEVVKYCKEKITSGYWGNIKSISARRFSSFPKRITDVGVMLDLTIHDVDVISYLLGLKASQVFTLGGTSKNKKYEDNIFMLLDFPNKITASCQTSWLTPNRVRDLSIISDTHYIEINYLKQEIMEYDTVHFEEPELIKLDYKEPLRNELIDFLTSIQKSSTPLVSLADGMQALKIVTAGLESLDKKAPVKL